MIASNLQRRGQIEEEINHVEAQFESVANRLRQGYDGGGDEVDKANDLVEQAKVMVRCQYLQQKRWQLAHAEERLAQGLIDMCEECGQPIEPARLEIWVGFTRCVSCQRRAEQKARRSWSCAA
jgi:RNA polymerase-binding transcription factor DksA